jgi:predicted dehydrogenase
VIRWGIVGPGKIAVGFADAMARVEGGEVVAVASRSIDRANDFADRYGIAARYDDDRALAEDPDVDVVYVATPHSRHEQDALLHIAAGKHVLCEKPAALNAAQTRRMVEAATAADVFFMEAVWSRFLPSYVALGEVLAAGRIGTPLQVDADFGFVMAVEPTARHFDPLQGGGALLDLGIYPIQLSTFVLGPVARVGAVGRLGETGVDEQVAAVLQHEAGGLGVVKAAITTPLACTARISGSEGWIDLPAFMHCPGSLTVHGGGAPAETIEAPATGNGLDHEIDEVHRCLAEGLTESPGMPAAESIALATVMDDIRAQIGLTYPGET